MSSAVPLGSLTGSLSLSVAYGLDVESESDKFYSVTEEAISALDLALPGTFLVDTFPIRTCLGYGSSGRTSQCPLCSKTRSGMVPRGRFQEVREVSEGDYR